MKPNIIGIGEILWDLLPSGASLGGAPANFSCHTRALGAEAAVVSRVGNDRLGSDLLSRLEGLGVGTSGITQDPIHPTGSVTAEVRSNGQPHYTIAEQVAWDYITANDWTLQKIPKVEAICFGTLAQRSPVSAATIHQLVNSTSPDALRVLDVNLRQDQVSKDLIESSLEIANVLKLNDDELPRISALLGITGSATQRLIKITKRFRLRMIAYTRGAEGSLLYDGTEWSDHRGTVTDLVDTIGAGDSFLAAVTMGILRDWPIGKINESANDVATFVCSQAGAIPPLPSQLIARFSASGHLGGAIV